MSLFVRPWATSCATSYWRVVTDAPGTTAAAQAEEPPDGLRDSLPVADVGKVVTAGQQLQLGPRDPGTQRPALLERHRPVVVAVQHERWHPDRPDQVGDVDVVGDGEHGARELWRRGRPLVPDEGRPASPRRHRG